MDDQVLVGEMDRGADPPEELEAAAERQAPFLAVAVDGHPLDVLHDEEGQRVVGGAAVEDAGDRGMLEAGEDLAFAGEAAQHLGGLELRVDQLERHPLLEVVLPHRQVDRSHAAAGDQALDAVGADAAAEVGVRPRRPGRVPRPARLVRRLQGFVAVFHHRILPLPGGSAVAPGGLPRR